MLIKQTKDMTERERIAVQNSNNQYLQSISYVAVGTIFPYAGISAPDSFMLCDGSELDVNEYADLFNVIGYTYGGSGDVFKIPDLRGMTLIGSGAFDYKDAVTGETKTKIYAVGQTGGEAEHTLTVDEMPGHSHNVVSSADAARLVLNQSGVGGASYAFADNLGNGHYSTWITDTMGGDQAHNNMPPYMVLNYIIKVNPNNIDNGQDYVLTEEDKAEIATMVKPIVDQTYNPESENAQSGKAVAEAVSDKQDSLVSGTNIKTINNQSILGSGNITIEGGSDVEVDQIYLPTSENAQSGKAVAEAITQTVGDIETALDEIIALQEALIGGDVV